jgi:hypothetical protein
MLFSLLSINSKKDLLYQTGDSQNLEVLQQLVI